MLASGRLPLLLLFVAFLVTFIVTRAITRMIRAGRGPFHDNVSGGVHIHHAVPGLVLLLCGAFLAVGVDGRAPWAEVAGVLVGVGASLVLDEFALILHLQDVYWSKQGQLSVQVVCLVAAVLGLAVLGVDPLTTGTGLTGVARWIVLAALPAHLLAVLVCVRKGKYSTAVIGAFLAPVAWVGALRLARPRSRWARRYRPATLARATARADGFDARFGAWGLDIADLVAGRPTAPAPAPSSPTAPTTPAPRPPAPPA